MRDRTRHEIDAELKAARKKFLDPEHLFAELIEEVGELVKAFLDETPQQIYDEAKRITAMVIRIMEEGDPAFAALRSRRNLGMYPGVADEEFVRGDDL